MTVPYSDEDFLLPDTMVVAKIPSIVLLVPRVGIIATMSARLFQQAFRTEPSLPYTIDSFSSLASTINRWHIKKA